ncbi:MAG TPA: hypothetical protein VIR45_11775 [Kiloniellaceae bacterium]
MRTRLAVTALALGVSVAGCAAFDGADAPDQIRLTGLEVAANPTVDIRYPALLSYEARGDVQVIDSCFLWYDKDADFTSFRSTLWFGEGPYCFAPESGAGPDAVKAMLASGYAGSYRLEGFVRYSDGGVTRESNWLSTEVTVRPRY